MTIYQHDTAAAFRFRLIGRLEQHFVTEFELCWRSAASILRDRPVLVDVTDLEGWDEGGARLLENMRASGVAFAGAETQTPAFSALGIHLLMRSPAQRRPLCRLRLFSRA